MLLLFYYHKLRCEKKSLWKCLNQRSVGFCQDSRLKFKAQVQGSLSHSTNYIYWKLISTTLFSNIFRVIIVIVTLLGKAGREGRNGGPGPAGPAGNNFRNLLDI